MPSSVISVPSISKKTIFCFIIKIPVSYTHLDVYKRQQTTAPQPTTPPESPRRILGIEDPTGRIGMMMVTAGVGLMAIAIVLIVRRELKK